MLKEMCDVMKEAYKRNWINIRDGNCALKFKGDNRIYMTPSGVKKNSIESDDIVYLDMLNDDIVFQKRDKITGEWKMHYYLLKRLKERSSSLHLHPPYIVAAMQKGWNLKFLVKNFPEVFRYTKVGNNVSNFDALSEELALNTFNNMFLDSGDQFDLVGQESHGVCAVGDSPWHAFEHIERVEHTCKIMILSGKSI